MIKALQEFKESQQKTPAVGIPSVSESTAASNSMLELAPAPRAAWAPTQSAEVHIRTTD